MAAEQPIKVESAGATKPIEETLFQFKWYLKKNGYSEATIISRAKLLKTLVKREGNLDDPESIKTVIAKQPWCPGRKENAVHAYTSFLKMHKKTWNPPRYQKIRKIPFIPTEQEIDQLIAGKLAS